MYYKPRAKSVISFLLSVLLFMTLLPVTVWAATLNVTDEAGLRTAILNANDGDIISIDADITLKNPTLSEPLLLILKLYMVCPFPSKLPEKLPKGSQFTPFRSISFIKM
jgi:hypothetical protein